MAASLFWVLYEGVGVWGNNIPVTWALDIVGYDWWIGVASGGLMVSAIMLLIARRVAERHQPHHRDRWP